MILIYIIIRFFDYVSTYLCDDDKLINYKFQIFKGNTFRENYYLLLKHSTLTLLKRKSISNIIYTILSGAMIILLPKMTCVSNVFNFCVCQHLLE